MFSHWLVITFLIFSFCIPKAIADDSSTDKTQLSVTYEQYHFVRSNTEFFREEASSALELFTFGFKQKKSWGGNWFSNIDADILLSRIEKKFYIDAPEFYLIKKKRRSQFTVGRKLQKWSWSDAYWDNGHWQPRFMWEKASPSQTGLIGFHYNKQWNKKLKTLFFASPFYVPEFSAGSNREDGRFSSENPWFNPPIGLVDIPGLGVSPIFYEVDKPAYIDVVLRPSVGFSLRQGRKNQWVQLSYLYKPNNKLLTNFDSYIGSGEDKIVLDGDDVDVTEPREVAGQVEVLPELFYHHLLSLESKWKITKAISFWTSYNYESPDRDLDFKPRVTYKKLSEGHVGALALKYKFGNGTQSTHLSFGYMKLSGGDEPDGGARASDKKSLFQNHYRYKNAFKLELVVPQVVSWNKYFSTKSSVIYDLDFKGLVFSNNINMKLNNKWNTYFKLDLIGLLDDEDIEKSFISSYRSNDQVALGVSYAF